MSARIEAAYTMVWWRMYRFFRSKKTECNAAGTGSKPRQCR